MTSFEDYYRRRRADALAYARAVVGVDCAEDACQEAWIRAWSTWATTKPERLDDRLADLVRASCDRVSRCPPATELADDDLVVVPSFEDDSVAALQVAGLWSLLRSLPPVLREVLFLRGVVDLSYAEIAEVQQVPMGTVMSRLHEARRRARSRLQNSRKIEYISTSLTYSSSAGP